MSDRVADVVVIGGGPAGSTAATALKRLRPRARVVLFERSVFPRHHVGESLLPDSRRVLQRIGVLAAVERAGFQRKGGITYRWRHDREPFSELFSEIDSDSPTYSWQVDRSQYDQLLLEHARSCGVEIFQPATVVRVDVEAGRVVGVGVREDGGAPWGVRCGHVVDCSGQARVLARNLGIERRTEALGDLAIYRYYRGGGWDERILGSRECSRIFFSATPAGWVWLITLAGDVRSVGMVTRRDVVAGRDVEELFDEQVAHVAELTALLEGAERIAPPGHASSSSLRVSNWSYVHERFSGPGFYIAGDAAAFVDPILSSGVHLAHRSGLNAAYAIATEWEEPSMDHGSLREAYDDFYRECCRGFVLMARWWYRQRSSGIEDWWRRAAEIGGEAGARGLDDMGAFMALAAGYFTDFRLEQLGPGFGRGGFAICIDGITGEEGAGERSFGHRGEGRIIERRFDSGTLEEYLGTFVESSRWWPLPSVRFRLGGREIVYRVPTDVGRDGVPDGDGAKRRLAALLAAIDDQRAFDDVIELAERTTGSRAGLAQVLSDLVTLGVLGEAEATSVVGRRAPEIADRRTPVAVAGAVCCELVSVASGVAGLEPATLIEVRLDDADGPVRYRAAPAGEGWAEAMKRLLELADGSHGADDLIRRLCASAPGSSAREGPAKLRDVANVWVADLMALGALRHAPV